MSFFYFSNEILLETLPVSYYSNIAIVEHMFFLFFPMWESFQHIRSTRVDHDALDLLSVTSLLQGAFLLLNAMWCKEVSSS